jgi:hypothetical protein
MSTQHDEHALFSEVPAAKPVDQTAASAGRAPFVLSSKQKFIIGMLAVAVFAGAVGVVLGRRGHESDALAQTAALPAPSSLPPSSAPTLHASAAIAPVVPATTTPVQAQAANIPVQSTTASPSAPAPSAVVAQERIEPAVAPTPILSTPPATIVQTAPRIESSPVIAAHQMLSSAGVVNPTPAKAATAAVISKPAKRAAPAPAIVPILAPRPVPALPSLCALTGTVHGENGEALPGIDGFAIVRFTSGTSHDVTAPLRADGSFSAPEIPAAGHVSIMIRAKKFRDLVVQLDRQNCGAAPVIALVKSNPLTSLRDAMHRATDFDDQAHAPQPATH